MLEPILPLLPLDQYGKNNFVLMLKCEGGNADTSLLEGYKVILKKVAYFSAAIRRVV